MQRATWALAILGLAPATHAFDFKGLHVGGPQMYTSAQVEEALFAGVAKDDLLSAAERRLGPRCGEGVGGGQVCNGRASVGGVAARANAALNSAGVITRVYVTFGAYSFDTVEQALREKFGKPTRITIGAVQNAMGAVFESRNLRWQGPDGRYISLEEYAGSLDESSLYFGSAEDTKLLHEISQPKKNDL